MTHCTHCRRDESSLGGCAKLSWIYLLSPSGLFPSSRYFCRHTNYFCQWRETTFVVAVCWLCSASAPICRRNRKIHERGWHKPCVCISANWRINVQKGQCCTTNGAETSFDVSRTQYTVLLSEFPSCPFICQGKQLI